MHTGVRSRGAFGRVFGDERRRRISRDGVAAIRNGVGALKNSTVTTLWDSSRGGVNILRDGFNIVRDSVVAVGDSLGACNDGVGALRDRVRRKRGGVRGQNPVGRGLLFLGACLRRLIVRNRPLIFRRLGRLNSHGRLVGRWRSEKVRPLHFYGPKTQ